MRINRHNYESFFLMYADNELSDAEKRDVHIFLEQNKDLLHEFELLQQLVLKPDDIVFEHKDSLLKRDTILQESLLLFLDNELNDDEKKKITAAIATDKAMSDEWNLLLQTKVVPDNSIEFENKKLLYRSDRKPVIAFGWWKLAAAAVFIGSVIWITASFFSKKNDSNSTVVIIKNNSKLQPIKPHSTDTSVLKQQQQNLVNNITITDKRRYSSKKIKPADDLLVRRDNNGILASDNLPKQNFSDNDSNKNLSLNVPQVDATNKMMDKKAQPDIDIIKPAQKDSTASSTSVQNVYASAASLNETDNDDHILMIPAEKLKKTSIGSFFKKLKKASHKSVRIANLEFALQ